MIHYAQSLLLAHLAEAAPQPIPMTPWWVVTFLWCQLRRQSGLDCTYARTRVEFWCCCPCFVAAIFWWNIQLEVPPRVEFTPHPQAGNTTGCGPNGVAFPYFLVRKYHPGGILGTTSWWQFWGVLHVRLFSSATAMMVPPFFFLLPPLVYSVLLPLLILIALDKILSRMTTWQIWPKAEKAA
jgi:hypothetical protein